MRRGGGKSKGAEFERAICKTLSLWISDGKVEDAFWRSAMSGGRSTVHARKGKLLAAQAGDISSVSDWGHTFINRFFIECKHYRDLKFTGILTKTGPLIQFWDEAKYQAKQYAKMPMLVAKQNQQPVVVCLGAAGLEALKLKGRCVLIAPKHNLHIVLLNDFIEHARFLCGSSPATSI